MIKLMLRLPSCPSSIAELEPFVSTLTSEHNVNQDLYPNILISLTEAVNNAIEHGNCLDKTKQVNIESMVNGKGLSLKVTDEGHGFCHHSLPDPTHPDHIETCGGRGVFLIKQLADKVQFTDNGASVEMYFKFKHN